MAKKKTPPPSNNARRVPVSIQPPSNGAVKLPDRPDVVPLIERIQQLRGSKVIALWYDDGPQISFEVVEFLRKQLSVIGHQKHIDFWLQSRGGQTEVPWLLVQMLREHCEYLAVLVPDKAHSGATHIALGADEIVMGPFSTLSPVDPSRRHPLLPQSPDGQQMTISAQDLKYAVAFIKREAGDEGLSGEAFGQIISALFDKIHPLAIGAIEQSYRLSRLITERMLTSHMNPDTEKDEVQRIVDAMSDSYGSHSFPIGLREAEHLGLKVKRAPRDLHEALRALLDYYASHKPSPYQSTLPTPQGPQSMTLMLEARLDSADLRVDAQGLFAKSGDRLERRGARWVGLPET